MAIVIVPPNNPTIAWAATLDPGHHSFSKWAICSSSHMIESFSVFVHVPLSHCCIIAYFIIACSVTWPMNGNNAGGDLVLIRTSLLFSCKSCCPYANYSTFI